MLRHLWRALLGVRPLPRSRKCNIDAHRSHGLSLLLLIAVFGVLAPAAHATVFSDVSGIVHDREHHPLASADVELKAQHSDLLLHTHTDANGNFRFLAVPFG